jgi:hypothetical protein
MPISKKNRSSQKHLGLTTLKPDQKTPAATAKVPAYLNPNSGLPATVSKSVRAVRGDQGPQKSRDDVRKA